MAMLMERLHLISEMEYNVRILEAHQTKPDRRSALAEAYTPGTCDSCDNFRPSVPRVMSATDGVNWHLDKSEDICVLTQRFPAPKPGGCKAWRLRKDLDTKT